MASLSCTCSEAALFQVTAQRLAVKHHRPCGSHRTDVRSDFSADVARLEDDRVVAEHHRRNAPNRELPSRAPSCPRRLGAHKHSRMRSIARLSASLFLSTPAKIQITQSSKVSFWLETSPTPSCSLQFHFFDRRARKGWQTRQEKAEAQLMLARCLAASPSGLFLLLHGSPDVRTTKPCQAPWLTSVCFTIGP